MVGVHKESVDKKWLYYSLISVACWGGYAICSKLGSVEITEVEMQFLFGSGTLPVALVLLARQSVRRERSPIGILVGLLCGLSSAVGTLSLFAAYRAGGNTSVVTVISSAYPVVTVLLAVVFLKERINRLQVLGIILAIVAAILFGI